MQKLAIFLLLSTANGLRVCETFPDYYLDENCHNNRDGDSQVVSELPIMVHHTPQIVLQPEIIKRHGYDVIHYNVITEDGYFLSLFRIPSKNNNSSPVFLQHGLAVNSAAWVAVGKNSLGSKVWLSSSLLLICLIL